MHNTLKDQKLQGTRRRERTIKTSDKVLKKETLDYGERNWMALKFKYDQVVKNSQGDHTWISKGYDDSEIVDLMIEIWQVWGTKLMFNVY